MGTIKTIEGKYGVTAEILPDMEPFDPWGDTDCYEGVKVYGPSRVPEGMEWPDYRYIKYDRDVAEVIREARLDGWTVIPVGDICETSQPCYYETDEACANGFLAVRPETVEAWRGSASKATLQRWARCELRDMIQLRDAYYRGDVYVAQADDDSLCGLVGFDYAMEVAEEMLKEAEFRAEREMRERRHWAERDVVTV